MDLSPFERINPCGHPGLALVQLSDLGGPDDPEQVGERLADILVRSLECLPAADGGTDRGNADNRITPPR
jgi:lipoyl(octanoyl) transferase